MIESEREDVIWYIIPNIANFQIRTIYSFILLCSSLKTN